MWSVLFSLIKWTSEMLEKYMTNHRKVMVQQVKEFLEMENLKALNAHEVNLD